MGDQMETRDASGRVLIGIANLGDEPCPYWADGQHCFAMWGPALPPHRLALYQPLTGPEAPPWKLTKRCACGAEVKAR